MKYNLGLIGYPVEHSLSPWIHEQLLSNAGLIGEYTSIEIEPDSFSTKILTLKDRNIDGFNVTVPYKEKIIPFLDEIDGEAQAMGAVNTVLNKHGKWIGFNTDGLGYLRSLQGKYPTLLANKKNPVLIIGAGGAARGIYYALVKAGFIKVDIANRTLEKACAVAGLKNDNTITACLSLDEAESALYKYAVIIQTTSIGMKPEENRAIMKLDQLMPGTIVSDIVYQPLQTQILKEAQEKGAHIHLGHMMLLYQAQYAFEIWTGQSVPIDNLDKKLQTILEG